jgi:hypothetical protein
MVRFLNWRKGQQSSRDPVQRPDTGKQQETVPQDAAEPPSPTLAVGDRVVITEHVLVFPAGSEGEVTARNANRGDVTYTVQFDHRDPVEGVDDRNLKRMAALTPGIFEIGTRVRLTQPFDGVLVDEDLAAERNDPQIGDDRVHRDAGTVGTVVLRQDGRDEHMMQPDRSSVVLFVPSSKLERLKGCIRVIYDGQGGVRFRQYFAYLDAVALREPVRTEEGRFLPEGAVGAIRPMAIRTSIVQEMQESWRTDAYTVYFDREDGEVSWLRLAANMLQLQSDLAGRGSRGSS